MYQALEHLPPVWQRRQMSPRIPRRRRNSTQSSHVFAQSSSRSLGLERSTPLTSSAPKVRCRLSMRLAMPLYTCHFLGSCRISSWRMNCCWIPSSSLRRKVVHTLRIRSSTTFQIDQPLVLGQPLGQLEAGIWCGHAKDSVGEAKPLIDSWVTCGQSLVKDVTGMCGLLRDIMEGRTYHGRDSQIQR